MKIESLGPRRASLAGLTCLALMLAGCVKPGAEATPEGGADAGTTGTPALTLVARDVEAPDVFNLSDKGLWDGRPSLGGVWVAHGSVKTPERVMIRNSATGKSVVGALFRREFDNPGPKLQVSSDAAEALGMLAGQPAALTVVALKREEPASPAEAAAAAEPLIGDKVNEPAGGDAAATKTAAATPAGAPPTSAPSSAPSSAAGAAAGAGAGAAAVAGADLSVPVLPEAQPAPKKKSWWPFGKRKSEAAADLAAASAPAAAPGTAAPGSIDATALAPIAGTVAPAGAAPSAATAPRPTATAMATASAPASALKRAYVQIGIFSVEANADKAAAQMKAAGMSATVKADQSGGKPFWRVIVGPAASEAERSALAGRVKGLGYPDAYPVSN